MIICYLYIDMEKAYTKIAVNKINNSRLLFCSTCGSMTSHEVEWLLSPLSLERECKLADELSDFRSVRKKLNARGLDIAVDDRSGGVIMNMCSVCKGIIVDFCSHDKKGSYDVVRIYPHEKYTNLPEPNADMPEKSLATYKEASEVFAISPRAAAGLMRLCLQQFCQEIEVRGKSLDEQIGELVKSGVPEFIQQYMDVCRCVGNSSVHPNVEIDVNEDPEVAKALFTAMNIIVENLVSIPKRAREAYSALPANFRKHVAERDRK